VSNPKPEFTDAELRVMLSDLMLAAWQNERGYNDRRSLMKKLQEYFKEADQRHDHRLDR